MSNFDIDLTGETILAVALFQCDRLQGGHCPRKPRNSYTELIGNVHQPRAFMSSSSTRLKVWVKSGDRAPQEQTDEQS